MPTALSIGTPLSLPISNGAEKTRETITARVEYADVVGAPLLRHVSEGADILGEWTLVSWAGFDGDGTRVEHGGGAPRGELIYLPSGRMAVQIEHSNRDRFGSTDWSAGHPRERAAAFSTYNAYCGTWSLPEPGVVAHYVELAIHPDQAGMVKRREYVLHGDELTLRTQEVETPGGPATSELVWRRRS